MPLCTRNPERLNSFYIDLGRTFASQPSELNSPPPSDDPITPMNLIRFNTSSTCSFMLINRSTSNMAILGQDKSRFENLPAELRLKTYGCVLPAEYTTCVKKNAIEERRKEEVGCMDWSSGFHSHILCQQARWARELAILYDENRLVTVSSNAPWLVREDPPPMPMILIPLIIKLTKYELEARVFVDHFALLEEPNDLFGVGIAARFLPIMGRYGGNSH